MDAGGGIVLLRAFNVPAGEPVMWRCPYPAAAVIDRPVGPASHCGSRRSENAARKGRGPSARNANCRVASGEFDPNFGGFFALGGSPCESQARSGALGRRGTGARRAVSRATALWARRAR